MEKTENLYEELRENIKSLVDFMKENNIDSTSINLETVSDFTFCNVKHNKGDDVLNEFTYIFEDNKEVQEITKIEDENDNDSESDNEDVNESIQNNESEPLNEGLREKEVVEEAVDNHEETPRNEDIKDTDRDNKKPDENTNAQNNNKKLIDFKEEYIYQKEVIGKILKEYGVI